MPELPEIEHLKRTLEPVLVGSAVVGVSLHRRDIVYSSNGRGSRFFRRDLLAGTRLKRLVRHGKQLAICASNGRVVCVHLGMSGHLRFVPDGVRIARLSHVHCVWRLQSRRGGGRLLFRDPRRFGGLWAFDSLDSLRHERWSGLGPDALTITADELVQSLRNTRRSIKAALLDQSVLAGVGNIYADESLFMSHLHPLSCASRIPADRVRVLHHRIQHVLKRAIDCGGSTIRDYADGNGQVGAYAQSLAAYGRAGKPCRRCKRILNQKLIAQRTTVFCAACQPRYSGLGRSRPRRRESRTGGGRF